MPSKTFSKNQIDKLGDKIRSEKITIGQDTLLQLQDYRTSHKESLSKVFNILCGTSRKIAGDSIVTYRIKRFESIINKLSRHPDMKFSRMWDIAGCRCIFKNNKDVYRLKELIEKELIIRKVNDYIETPQEEGYRSLHLYVCLPDDSRVIEVQVRCHVDHNWATLVEITDVLFDAKLKEYGFNKELLRFHLLLSRKDKLTLREKREIADVNNKYDYFKKISEVFSRNYLEVRKQWLEIESNFGQKFFLIETRRDQPPKILSFVNFTLAEEKYFNSYQANEHANMVLTHLPTPNYRHISMAYSNYVLTVHSFQDDLFEIFEELILEYLRKAKYWSFLKYYRQYNKTVYVYIENLFSEIKSSVEYTSKLTRRERIKIRKKEREWNSDMSKHISNRVYHARRLQKNINTNWPKSIFRKSIFSILASIIAYQNSVGEKKIIKKLESINAQVD